MQCHNSYLDNSPIGNVMEEIRRAQHLSVKRRLQFRRTDLPNFDNCKIRPQSSPPSEESYFQIGNRVEATLSWNETEWYKATIMADNEDGTYEIEYDDKSIKCETCHGEGEVSVGGYLGFFSEKKECPECEGVVTSSQPEELIRRRRSHSARRNLIKSKGWVEVTQNRHEERWEKLKALNTLTEKITEVYYIELSRSGDKYMSMGKDPRNNMTGEWIPSSIWSTFIDNSKADDTKMKLAQLPPGGYSVKVYYKYTSGVPGPELNSPERNVTSTDDYVVFD